MTAIPSRPRAQDRLVRMPEVRTRTGLHRSTIYRRVHAGTFPAGIQIGENATAWYESDVDAWVADPMGWRPAVQDQAA